MGTNGFREDELITETVNGQTRVFPVVGGRLRLAHEENQNLNLQTEMVNWDGQYAIFKCSAVTSKGQYVGYGTANSQRDAKLADSLVELAETRSIARALRFAGYGVEFTSAEEVSHVVATEPDREQSGEQTTPAPVFPEGNGNGKVAAKAPNGAAADDRDQNRKVAAMERQPRRNVERSTLSPNEQTITKQTLERCLPASRFPALKTFPVNPHRS